MIAGCYGLDIDHELGSIYIRGDKNDQLEQIFPCQNILYGAV